MPDADLDQAPDEPLGDHVLELQIAEVVAETDDARSLVFAVPDEPGDPAIPPQRLRYAPGQFLTLRVPSDRTGSVARCYSLCSSPFTDDALTVTVKRTADGYASNWLCDHAHKGMRVHVLAPSGTFVPKTLDGDFLLLAAGSGITPIMSICKSALSEGSGQVTLLYANRDEGSVIFADALRELSAKYPDRLTVVHWLESLQGLPSTGALAKLAAPFTDRPTFICGPGPFMDAARQALETLKVPAKQVHIEVFKSLDSDPFAAVTIDDTPEGSDETGRRPPRPSCWTVKPTPCRGRAAPSCSTCCWPRALTRRSRAARVTAGRVPAPCAAARSIWRSTTS